MYEVYVVDGVRTPMGKYGGALAAVRPDDLAAHVVSAVVQRSQVPPDRIDEVILGATNQAGEDNRNVARMATLLAGLPQQIPGYTVNRLCASGLTAVASGAQAIISGEADVIVAGGVESMTRAPWVMAKPGVPWARPGEVVDTSIGWRFTNPRFTAGDDSITMSMGDTAEEVARELGIDREDSDAFAARSHRRALDAIDGGRFAGEIVAVPVGDASVCVDEPPRRGTDADKLARLRPAFRRDGIVTAGSSSSLADGAAALVLASAAAVDQFGLQPRARIVGSADAGVAPRLMGLGPVPATEKLLHRVGWKVGDLGAIELNEAFAVQAIGVIRELGLDEDMVNADGGAIALGHPLGCSGARILVTLIGRMERERARRGMATMCVGVGQGVSMVLEGVQE